MFIRNYKTIYLLLLLLILLYSSLNCLLILLFRNQMRFPSYMVGFISTRPRFHRQERLLMCRRTRRKRISLGCQKPLCCVTRAHIISRIWAYVENPSQSTASAVLTQIHNNKGNW